MIIPKTVEIKAALDGHNRMAGRWGRRAKQDGAGSPAHIRYVHHLRASLALTKQLTELRHNGG